MLEKVFKRVIIKAISAFAQCDGTCTEQCLNGSAWRNRGITKSQSCR